MSQSAMAPPRMLQAAVVGAGFMAAVHSRAIRNAGGSLAAGTSSTPAGARDAAARLGIATAYDTLEDLLADESVDVVHICTPNTTHHALAAAALRAGKHVICEKPLTTTLADALELDRLAAERGLHGSVPFIYRFHPMVREARARIAAGTTGRLLTLQASYLQDWLLGVSDDDWRVDPKRGGPSRAFADIGSHLCDLIEFSTGQRITRLNATKRTVHAQRATHSNIATEDVVALVAEFDGGLLGTLLVSQVAPGHKNALVFEVAGTAESVRFAQETPEDLWIGTKAGNRILPRDAALLTPDAARLSLVPAGHPMGYQDAFNAFVADSYAAIAGETPDGLPTFADGLRAVRLTEAVLESAATGHWVEVPG
ncbi:Gfo/Idh/MocA family protein [Paeniglutamicibacter psychrophenolicus]|uniref:Gfo/Idh/MocA family protein n=1 Tax=Paeniglutamicibacter psychrophenolicus TaxID=257454 RepID=UPI002788FB91|nr:Gfo/Idh/MocA family oxidoreductase [Paeniglutamicibacter psychrophenolicus]MDQ0094182.1 putative dehydrogenase [Paeniglutamicibacter psychrophenolicus]